MNMVVRESSLVNKLSILDFRNRLITMKMKKLKITRQLWKSGMLFGSLVGLLAFLTSCGSDDSTDPFEVITNSPPLSDYYLGSQNGTEPNGNQGTFPVYTTDLETYVRITNEHLNVYNVTIAESHLIMVNTNPGTSDFLEDVIVAPVDDPSNTRFFGSDKYIRDVELLDGLLIAYAVDGNNHYLGYCDTNSDSEQFTYNLLTAGLSIPPLDYIGSDYLLNVGDRIVLKVQGANGTVLGHTGDGQTINFTVGPEGVSHYSYLYHDNKLWALFSNQWYHTDPSNLDLSSIEWTGGSIDTNTTDIPGYFSAPWEVIIRGKEWRLYGTISAYEDGNITHVVNISTDSGSTWTTHELSGLTLDDDNFLGNVYWLGTNCIVQVWNNATGNTAFYSSSDGINFTSLSNSNSLDPYEYQDVSRLRYFE